MLRRYDYAPELTVERARELRQRLTRAETLLWHALRNSALGFRFRRQHPVGAFILDFYCREIHLGIEIDGPYHLATPQAEYDASRSEALMERSIEILRFTNEQVLDSLDEVLQTIMRESKRRRPSP